jgi:hypothetical protein
MAIVTVTPLRTAGRDGRECVGEVVKAARGRADGRGEHDDEQHRTCPQLGEGETEQQTHQRELGSAPNHGDDGGSTERDSPRPENWTVTATRRPMLRAIADGFTPRA